MHMNHHPMTLKQELLWDHSPCELRLWWPILFGLWQQQVFEKYLKRNEIFQWGIWSLKWGSAQASQVVLVVKKKKKKKTPANAGDLRNRGLIPGLGRSPGEGHCNPLQYSCLENPMDRGAWQAAVYRVTKSWAKLKRLSMHTKNIFTKSCFHRLPLWLNWSACNAGDLSWIPGLGRSPGEGKGYPLQYFGLENSMDSIVCGVAKSWIRLSDFHFTCFYRSLSCAK